MEPNDDFFTRAWLIEDTALNAVTNSTRVFIYVSKYTERGKDTFDTKASDGSILKDVEVMAITLLCYGIHGLTVKRAFGLNTPDAKQGLISDLENQNYHALYKSMKPSPTSQPKEPYALPPDEDWQWLGDGWYRI